MIVIIFSGLIFLKLDGLAHPLGCVVSTSARKLPAMRVEALKKAPIAKSGAAIGWAVPNQKPSLDLLQLSQKEVQMRVLELVRSAFISRSPSFP